MKPLELDDSYGNDVEHFNFYRIPKMRFTSHHF